MRRSLGKDYAATNLKEKMAIWVLYLVPASLLFSVTFALLGNNQLSFVFGLLLLLSMVAEGLYWLVTGVCFIPGGRVIRPRWTYGIKARLYGVIFIVVGLVLTLALAGRI